ncbi:DNA polymerase III subunit gamma/tau [Oryzomonas sagensis]|uniref:DNA polymerase III subunit gamma/tau n=1 Tax=Oryzomonas sagensis TaxID=2603857 RepID=A0ABQ6TQX6_9BACT|nr:DNA polymerase III subunit gamma/tau [Oryzomonas sagensis]KAB0671418.1 DNA polymerase III subunit gamma/tau [Oryzomonas sagensis]
MSYVVLARKYRPQTFSELTGQEHVSRTLQNAIDTGRVAHAFLFTGARGVGKTSSARILAKALNCEQGLTTEPCNVCPICKEITDGTSTDVFEIDGASNTGVDDVRDLRDNIKYLPSHSRYKIFIIDEVHMLSTSAFNALLKTLEEPPAHVKFIFATTEPHKVPVTILSRCQRFDFKRILLPKLIERLRFIAGEEGISISDAALAMIARKGDGSMRDSLSVFDQVLAFCGNSVSDEDVATMIGAVDRRLLAEISAAVFAGDTQGVLAGVKRVDGVGYNMRQFCQELIDHFRNLLVIRSVKSPEEILDLAEAELEELRRQAGGFSAQEIQRRLTLLLKAETEMAYATFPRLILEIALLKAATLVPVIPIQELLEKIKGLETGAVHTPALPWDAVRPAAPAATAAAAPPHRPAPPRDEPASQPVAAAAQQPPVRPQARGGYADWERFVAFCIEKRPANGSVLEHGSPLKLEPGQMEIGFPAGYYLDMAQDADFIAEIRTLAQEFTGHETVLRIKAIRPETGETPQSLAEKKKSDNEHLMEELKREVAGHPVINEAARIFGGIVTDVRKA